MQAQNDFDMFVLSASFLFVILLFLIICILFLHNKEKKGFLREVEQLKSNFEQELFKTQLEIQEETFQHISLELHDNVGHFLSLAKLHLTTIHSPIPKHINEKLGSCVAMLTRALSEIRSISTGLNPEHIKSNGLIDAIDQQVRQLKRSGSYIIEFTVTGKTSYLDDEKEILLFRILQEALNNIVNHSKASRIDIRLCYREKELGLRIADNGTGFNAGELLRAANHRSSGLQNMIKRSARINATCEISSSPGKGTVIHIRTPL